jgi:hypothetical protein
MGEQEKTPKPEDEALARQERALRVEQEARIDKSKAEAEAAGQGSGKPEKGTNPDG